MCGIIGVISGQPLEFSSIRQMNGTLAHRGPDAEGYLLSIEGITGDTGRYPRIQCPRTLAFGHRRLAIIDLSDDGIQPMSYRERYWIIYNGELYNYLELKDQLKLLGYRFETDTDTEVVLAAYAEWGHACLEEFNGMWSFAIYDAVEERLFLSRDRFGIKPLYYYQSDNLFIFASEIKAILQHPGVSAEVNRDYCNDFYQTGAREFAVDTAFQGIFRFPGASYCEIDINTIFSGKPVMHKYWSLPALDRDRVISKAGLQELAQSYHDLLQDSVQLRLRSDVDVGVTLSGGLDSSSIACLCRDKVNQSGRAIETFSSVYPSAREEYCDESSYIDSISAFLDVKNNRIHPDVNLFREEHRKMIHAMDNPPDSTCMSGWFTYKLLGSSSIRVNLEGQGADELLAGYRRYITRYYACGDIRIIFSAIKNIFVFRCFVRNILFGVFLNIVKRMFPVKATRKIAAFTGYHEDPYLDADEQMQLDLGGELANLLKYADTESMYNSVETRFPFLDYRLVEFMGTLPVTCKIHNGWTKYLARAAFDKKLPDSVVWRKEKQGWPVPDRYWLREVHFDWVRDTIERSSFLDALIGSSEIRRVLKKKNEIIRLVRLLNLAVWHDVYFDDNQG